MKGGSRSTISVPTNITDGSSPMSRPGERRMYRMPCSPAVMSASMTAATVLAGARMPAADSNQKSSAVLCILRSRTSRSVRHHHRGADRDTLVEVGDVVIQHPDAAIGHEAAD